MDYYDSISMFVCEPFGDEFPACFSTYEEALEFQAEYGGSIQVEEYYFYDSDIDEEY